METKVQKIGVLTSGGDAPGMNAAIRSVVRTAIVNGLRVMGIKGGYQGLIDNDIEELTIRSVSGIIHRGGTVLNTARSNEFHTEEGQQKAIENIKAHEIDALVVIGGDGSFRGALDLTRKGIPCVGIPGTIDNDIACSEYTIGYDTAMNTAMEMVDKLRDTAQSHQRCSIVEVMGRKAGYIALNTGIACGATAILIPEFEVNLQRDVIERINQNKALGRRHFIVLVAEGVGLTKEIEILVKELTGIETRVTILGHVQRGGSPTLRDRVMASQMGHHAVTLLTKNEGGRVVAQQKGRLVDFDFEEALQMVKTIDQEQFDVAHDLSI